MEKNAVHVEDLLTIAIIVVKNYISLVQLLLISSAQFVTELSDMI